MMNKRPDVEKRRRIARFGLAGLALGAGFTLWYFANHQVNHKGME